MKFRLTIHIVLAMLLLTLLGRACKEPPREKENGTIKIAIDWSDIPRSQSLSLFIYDATGALVKQTETQTECCDIELPRGKYQLIAHNSEAKQVEFRGMERYETAEVFACKKQENSESPDLHILEPHNIYSTSTNEQLVVDGANVLETAICPVPLTKTLTLNFTIKNIEVHSVVGKLTGVAEGVFLSTGTRNNTSCCIGFNGTLKQGSTTEYEALFNIFDLQTTTKADGINFIELTITDHSGNVYKASADITSFVQNIASQNDGIIPTDIPIVLHVSPNPVTEQITVSILNWDFGGTGAQNINEDHYE